MNEAKKWQVMAEMAEVAHQNRDQMLRGTIFGIRLRAIIMQARRSRGSHTLLRVRTLLYYS